MLRVELSPNGAFNVTEFGTVKDPEQFQALHAYSPYHHVKDGDEYPAVLFLTGANDPRVDPMQSRKMTARLQAADPAGQFLLRTSDDSGHGARHAAGGADRPADRHLRVYLRPAGRAVLTSYAEDNSRHRGSPFDAGRGD